MGDVVLVLDRFWNWLETPYGAIFASLMIAVIVSGLFYWKQEKDSDKSAQEILRQQTKHFKRQENVSDIQIGIAMNPNVPKAVKYDADGNPIGLIVNISANLRGSGNLSGDLKSE